MVACGGRDASAAIFHQGNIEVVVRTESGDTIAEIAQDAARVYELTDNVGRCTSALIQEVHGVSVYTYRQNPKRYDRNFHPEQVYVLPGACVTNLEKGAAKKTVEIPSNDHNVQPVVSEPAHIAITTDPTTPLSTPTSELLVPTSVSVPTQEIPEPDSQKAPTSITETAPTVQPIYPLYTAYMPPPTNADVDDQAFRNGIGNKERCIRNGMNEVVYYQQAMQDFPDPIIAQAVYANTQRTLLSLFDRGCSKGQMIPNARQDA